jgi:hypothetical protein
VRPKHVLIEFKKWMCYIDGQKNKYSALIQLYNLWYVPNSEIIYVLTEKPRQISRCSNGTTGFRFLAGVRFLFSTAFRPAPAQLVLGCFPGTKAVGVWSLPPLSSAEFKSGGAAPTVAPFSWHSARWTMPRDKFPSLHLSAFGNVGKG